VLAPVPPESLTGFGHSYPSNSLPSRHLLSHEQKQSQVTILHPFEQAAKLRKQSCFFVRTAPQFTFGNPALQEMRQMGEHNPNFDGCTGILRGAAR